MKVSCSIEPLRGRLRTEHPLKSWAGKLHANEPTARRFYFPDVHHAATRRKIGFLPTCHLGRLGYPDLEIRADGHLEPRQERGSASAQIFTGSIFGEDDASRIFSAHLHRKSNGNSTLRALPRSKRAHRLDHGPGPFQKRPLDGPLPRRLRVRRSARKIVRPLPALRSAFSPRVQFCEVRCRFPRRA